VIAFNRDNGGGLSPAPQRIEPPPAVRGKRATPTHRRPMAKAPKLRIYWRDTGSVRRAYGDFRAWKDVGGAREPLVPQGATLATTDPAEAASLYIARAGELDSKRKKQQVLGEELGIERTVGLKAFAAHHLRLKAQSGGVTDGWLQNTEARLTVAVDFFGADKELHTIGVREVQKYAAWLATQPIRRGNPSKKSVPAARTLGGQSQRHYLNALSNLFRRAQAEAVVPLGHNPVALLMEKPTAKRQEARWLEAHEAALLLESARTYKPKRGDLAMPFAYPLLATYLLTGGRGSEVRGLQVEDVSFDRKTVTFRPNDHRRLKTGTSHRVVPLWPQLEEILREYVFGGDVPMAGGLLFPSFRTSPRKAKASERKPEMLTDLRKMLDAIGERAGWKPGEIRSKMFRHTYCAARLQTTDRGEAVSTYTVAKELGHGGDSLVKRVYGHLGTVRHRRDVVEYRVDDHRGALADRLPLLRNLV
jgi:integrase